MDGLLKQSVSSGTIDRYSDASDAHTKNRRKVVGISAQIGHKIYAAIQDGEYTCVYSTQWQDNDITNGKAWWIPESSSSSSSFKGYFKSLSNGRLHSVLHLLSTDTNRDIVWTKGSNSLGQRGDCTSNPTDEWTLLNLPQLQKDKIEQIQCGHDHTVILLKSGTVYSSGWNTDGQCAQDSHVFKTVHEFTTCVSGVDGDGRSCLLPMGKISCSSDHALAVSTDRKRVFAWGNNEYYQCGGIDSTTHDKFESIHEIGCLGIRQQDEEYVQEIACGNPFSVVRTSSNRLIIFGYGSVGLADFTKELDGIYASGDFIVYVGMYDVGVYLAGKILGETTETRKELVRLDILDKPSQISVSPDQIACLVD